MDAEKAIDVIYSLKGNTNVEYVENGDIGCDLAIEALEKQIPKEPIKHTKLPNGRFTYLCPTCNRLYWDKEFLSDCCCSCGQKLD